MQDFLLEAGEILELLNEQTVELESNPEDKDLLNAVFRSFHTIKGGAGFLGIDALVTVCHTAENVFDVLRQGKRSVDAELMDVVLEVLDVVNHMFGQIRSAEDPTAADENLIARLNTFSVPAEVVEPVAAPAPVEEVAEEQATSNESAMPNDETTSATGSGSIDEITEDEFETLLDELHGKGSHSGIPKQDEQTNAVAADTEASEVDKDTTTTTSDNITDDEFEALLDDLHGKGAHSGIPEATEEAEASAVKVNDDNITDDEFEALLDNLQANKEGAFKQVDASQGQEATRSEPETAADKIVELKSVAKQEAAKPVDMPADKPAAARQQAPQAETTVRVETSTLDRIMNMVGELVLVRNRLSNLEAEIGHDEMSKTVSNLDVVTADLQTYVMKTRMQPIKKVFGRFPRVVRDLARSLKKEVVLEMIGEETDLDKNLVEALADPLVHLVRNSVDHGVEMPDVREAAGKPRQGTVVLSAEQEGDHILLTIQDDGAGIDADVLRQKVVEKGLMDEDAVSRLSDKEVYNLIFLPGFSTKQEISDISGRGVGMDVVKTRINQLNGMIDIDSTRGKGTIMSIKVPLTLAIMPTLMVKLGKEQQTFALPLVNVNEIIELDTNRINKVDGQSVIIVRGKPIPLFYLNGLLHNSGIKYEGGSAHVVIVSVGTSHVGLLVDKLLGREEVVIKPLGAMLQGTRGLAGATITGNGKIALIVDLPDLIQARASNF